MRSVEYVSGRLLVFLGRYGSLCTPVVFTFCVRTILIPSPYDILRAQLVYCGTCLFLFLFSRGIYFDFHIAMSTMRCTRLRLHAFWH